MKTHERRAGEIDPRGFSGDSFEIEQTTWATNLIMFSVMLANVVMIWAFAIDLWRN